MKKHTLLLTLLSLSVGLFAQDAGVEATIRDLEQKEKNAVMMHDTAALLQLWAADFTVTSPMNQVVKGGRNTLDRPVMQKVYNTFERQTETVMVKGDVAISMGNEVVVEKGKDGAADKTMKRRYTNIWQKQGANWMLIARHANNICDAP